MKVLMQIRADYRERPGGDATQAERTAAELRLLGVDVDLIGGVAPDLAGYNLVHIFNTQVIGEPVRQAIRARSWGLPVVLSPIYWNPAGFRAATHPDDGIGAGETASDLAERALQRLTLGAAAILLPNSHAEAAQITATFSDVPGQMRVVPNAVDPLFANGNGARFCAEHGLTGRGFVLCAGRKEALKNQLGLIRACRELRLPLVLAGQENAEAAAYVAECRALAEGAPAPVLFLPNLTPVELADAYAAARVHVQPSYYETVGLSSLEAALGGCNIVATRNSGVAEYLGEAAWYCDPSTTRGIVEPLAAAWAAPLDAALGQRVTAEHTWHHAAGLTLRAYEEVVRMAELPQTTRWLPTLTTDEYVTHLEELIQLQLEATAFRDRQFAEVQAAHGALYAEFKALQEYHTQMTEANAEVIKNLEAGLHAEAAERRRTEEGFKALEAQAIEQSAYLAKLEAELAARPPAPTSRWPRIGR
ncbi:MAG TPA: glycosyltransferase family 4 protein [Thermomicrobiales bacterium]|jgi:glycosyltransferase involved in cell wall biosynthesis